MNLKVSNWNYSWSNIISKMQDANIQYKPMSSIVAVMWWRIRWGRIEYSRSWTGGRWAVADITSFWLSDKVIIRGKINKFLLCWKNTKAVIHSCTCFFESKSIIILHYNSTVHNLLLVKEQMYTLTSSTLSLFPANIYMHDLPSLHTSCAFHWNEDESEGMARVFPPPPDVWRKVKGKVESFPITSMNADRISSRMESSDMSELSVTFPWSPNLASVTLCFPLGTMIALPPSPKVLGKHITSLLYCTIFGAFFPFGFEALLLKKEGSLWSLRKAIIHIKVGCVTYRVWVHAAITLIYIYGMFLGGFPGIISARASPQYIHEWIWYTQWCSDWVRGRWQW